MKPIQAIKSLKKLVALLENESELPDQLVDEIDENAENLIRRIQAEKAAKSLKQTSKNPIEIWSDGACSGNPGPGGWGTIVDINGQRFEYSGGKQNTTNNIMELTGALEGIKSTPVGSNIVLKSDSQYLVKGMTEWLTGWKKKGWKKSDGKDVLNKDLWVELDQAAQKRSIRWVWIKGHAGHSENERCDELAREAISR